MGWDFRGVYTVASDAAIVRLQRDPIVGGTWARITPEASGSARLAEPGLLVVHGFRPACQVMYYDGCPWDAFWPDGAFDAAELRESIVLLGQSHRPPVNLVAWMCEIAAEIGAPVALYQCDMDGGDIGDESALICAAGGIAVVVRDVGVDPLQSMLRAFGGTPIGWRFGPHERAFPDRLRPDAEAVGRFSLYTASRNGAAETVVALLGRGAEPDEHVLERGAESGSADVVAALLRAGAPIKAGWPNPLGRAANPACARLLVEAGAVVDDTPAPLAAAAERGFAGTVAYLRGLGAIVDFRRDGHALWFAAAKGGLADLVEEALATGPELEREAYGGTALALAAGAGHAGIVDRLLAAGAELNAETVIAAAEGGHAALLRSLLERGADPESRKYDRPALRQAAYHGHRDAMLVLLAAGADPAGNERHRPLHGAIDSGDVSLVELLLDVRPTLVNLAEGGYPPLWSAVGHGQQDIVDLLLARGADPEAHNPWGSSVRDFAQHRNIRFPTAP